MLIDAKNAILLVRPQKRAQDDVEICVQNQFLPVIFPLIEIEKKQEALDGLQNQLMQADAVFWVSPSAVELAFEKSIFFENQLHIAVGKATAKALQQKGIDQVFCPQNARDSEAVLQLNVWKKLPEKSRILIVRGENGRPYLAEQLLQRGFEVMFADIYRRRVVSADWQVFEKHPISTVWITSSQLVDELFQQAPSNLKHDLLNLLYVTHHHRIAEQLKKYGVHRIICSESLKDAFYSECIMSEIKKNEAEKETVSSVSDAATNEIKTENVAPKNIAVAEKTASQAGSQAIVIEQKGGGKGMAVGALILSLIALGAGGFLFTQGQAVLKNHELQFKQDLERAALGEGENSLKLQSALQKQNDLGEAVSALLQAQQNTAQKTENLQAAYQELLRGRTDWLVDEIEVTLNLASQQLLLSGNVPVAVSVLESVEQRLNRFEQADLLPIKQAVSSDLVELKKRPHLNIPAVALRLNRLENAAASLPLVLDKALQGNEKQEVETAHSADFWTRAWDRTLNALRGMVEVRRLDNQDAMLIAPDQIYFVRENLRLRLLDARLALMQYNGEVYQSDLAAIDVTVRQYFDLNSPNTQAWLQELAELRNLDVRMVSDNALAASQNAVRVYQNNARTALPIKIEEVAKEEIASSASAAVESAQSTASETASASEVAASEAAASAVDGGKAQ